MARVIGISAAAQQAAEDSLSFNLNPATNAEEKNGTYRWYEIAKVMEGYTDSKTSGDGREMTLFYAKLSVTPLNPDSRSVGKPVFFRAYMDVETWENGTGPDGMVTMNNISISRLKSLMASLGYALTDEGDITPDALLAMFPEKGKGQSASLGEKVQVNLWRGKKKDKRDGQMKESTEVQSFAPYEG